MRTVSQDSVVEEIDEGPPSIIEPLLNDNINVIEVHKGDELVVRMPSMWEVRVYHLQRCLPVISPTIELAAGDKVEVVDYIELVTPTFIPPNEKKRSKNMTGKTEISKNLGHWNSLRHVRVRSTSRSLYPFKPLLFNPFYLAWPNETYANTRQQNLRINSMLDELFNPEGDL